ncbi:hypothetical protein [Kribbella qitaiheensis]|nr:hypothetical protein [Kribbella qitaiheensis]
MVARSTPDQAALSVNLHSRLDYYLSIGTNRHPRRWADARYGRDGVV